ncbi:metalloprotease [Aureisphaera galaxeae]|uniref:metalloprotease n=1 Tax=Aureisphaera galaxeae TaxID=1538023 RepID=UPI00234FEB05|nr:metalloprotease [Aureisphaera galaxeae]MDC8004620.1 metalloprotease [Aureisphaera galaxeae]
MKKFWFIILVFAASLASWAQHDITVDAVLNTTTHTIDIQQEIVYQNTSEVSLNEIYLLDWANSFSNKNTPLAKRFAENFKSGFHFEKDENRGRTTVNSINDANGTAIIWERGEEVDILKAIPASPVAPGGTYTLKLNYSVKLPEDKFTRYGVDRNQDYKIKYWIITPAVFNGEWQHYSHKNTDDYFQSPTDFSVTLEFPFEYSLFSDLNEVPASSQGEASSRGSKRVSLEGKGRMFFSIYLQKTRNFESVVTDQLELITDLKDKKVAPANKAILVDRLTRFLEDRLGPYPFEKMIISDADYRTSPVYGLNQLPDFISPFPNGFELDMELLKTATRRYITQTLPLNPRKDHWLIGALQIYLMIDYVDTYYPDMKILGSLSDFWIIDWLHAADLEFNDQYPFLYLNMARNNLHQSLVTPRDSLVKFNKQLGSDYYAGDGLQYLADYVGKSKLDKTIKEYFTSKTQKLTTPSDFQKALKANTELPIDWFFSDYVGKRTTIDFKIKKVKEVGDSLEVSILNKRDNVMPVSIYGLKKDSVLFKKWVKPIDSIATITVPKEGVRKLALNYNGEIAEFNQRNNFKAVKGLFNRPLQFRLFKDVEDPKFNQVFFMPVFQYNLYDGFSLGPKMYNKTMLPKGVHYKLEPQFGFRSKKIIGKGSLVYTERVDNGNLYSMRYGISGSFFSYNRGLFYKRLSPFMTFAFRDNDDLRKNKKQFINLRNVNVFRDEDPNDPDQDPNYSVFNFQYVYTDNNLINFYRGVLDYQISQKFSKISTQLEYRKLFLSNRQLNVRFYAGLFVFNDTGTDSDFFSFALDRPTDYLFDYNYYGRSEDTGLFSQQLIIAEGGFKSQLEPAFANQFITTVNASTNIWKWIYAYGDAGLVKNNGEQVKAVWDTGIRASLVADYFELYFPLYSNLGWEPGLPDYDQRIRFIVTLDIKTLLGLFTREWY